MQFGSYFETRLQENCSLSTVQRESREAKVVGNLISPLSLLSPFHFSSFASRQNFRVWKGGNQRRSKNKNRICSKTWVVNWKKRMRQNKKWALSNVSFKKKLNAQWIPPRREILLKSLRSSHPKEKSGLRLPDPTPKRNLVKERQILIKLDGSHPEENYGWEKRGREQKGQVDLDLDLRSTLIQGRDLKVVPQQQQQQQLSPFYDLSASPQVKKGN